MNNLLLFFAFPIATIILSIVVQKLLRNTILTTLTFFAIYLVLTFSMFDINFLIFAIAYTILACVSALVTEFIIKKIGEVNTDILTDDVSENCLRQNYIENDKCLRKINSYNYDLNGNKNCYYRR